MGAAACATSASASAANVKPSRRMRGVYRTAAASRWPLRTEGLAPGALHRNLLRPEHLVLQREHAARCFVDVSHKCQRALQNRLEPLAILDARLRIFVLDHQMRVGHVERQQLAR